ncbi:MAG: hypothetical protein KF895_05430 [Parvibaculum sp.]|nr:hypothetical protein [Parvibaculum sp.]
MNILSRIGVVAAALLMLAGCATQPAIPFDSSSAGQIKTIGILTPDIPTGPSAILASSVGQSFGLIGALVDAGMQSSRESDLKSMLNSRQFVAHDKLMAGVTASLEAQGYEVRRVSVARSERGEFLKTYPLSNTEKVDAYLDIVMRGYGYIAAGITDGTPYRPIVETRVRLVSAKDSSVLMEDVIFYNRLNATYETTNVTISPDPAYSFSDFSSLERDPDKAVEGLDIAFAKSTEAIATLLR